MPEKGSTGVAKALDIESISKDIAELANQLGREAEGPIETSVLDRVSAGIQKIRSKPRSDAS